PRTGGILARASRERQIRLLRIARDDVCDEGTGDRLHVQNAGLGIERRALPVGAAARAWKLDRAFGIGRTIAFDRWGREHRTDDVALDDFERLGAKRRCEVDQVVDRNALPVERRWLRGKRLGR